MTQRRRLRFTVTVFLLSLAFSLFSFASHPAHGSALLLPLTLSPPRNYSRSIANDVEIRHRLLRNTSRHSPIARLGLRDDLLASGYYTAKIGLGTPPQNFALIVDTGSTATYVPCAACLQCGRHQDPKFQPNKSSTYQPLKCNSVCTCDETMSQCIYERQYAEMSSSSGVLIVDAISFGNLSELKPQPVVFGCEYEETGDIYSQHADGLMGLGRHDLSVVDQLVDQGVINNSFSLCYGGMDSNGGAMILGQISTPSDMVFTKSDPDRSPYYNIEMKEIHVAGKKVPVDASTFDEKHGTIVDSGTTYAYLPEEAFVAFKQAFMSELHDVELIPGPDPVYNDLCFAGPKSGELSKTFPSVDLVFGTGQKYSLSPENYIFRHAKLPGAYCLGVFQNGKDPTTLLGGIITRNTLVTYDRQNLKVGFWKTNCSELWQRLNMSNTSVTPAPSPVPASSPVRSPAPSNEEHSTLRVSPASAPSRPLGHHIPGEIEVGYITFEMSLSMNHSALKPRLSEFGGSIAQELGLDSSQILVLNSTSNGNGSLTRWAIYPEGSAEYFSNKTATRIISHLSENDIQLPKIFGKYQLVKWSTQPAVKRTWWEEHYLVIVMTVILILMLALSAYGIWFVWKWRQLTTQQYRPVNSYGFGAEQELQPL